jgi:hypothetical protein
MRLLKHTFGAVGGVVVVDLEVEAGIVLGCGVGCEGGFMVERR